MADFQKLMKLFDIRYRGPRIAILVSLVCIGFVGWLSLREAVESQQRLVVDEEIKQIELKVDRYLSQLDKYLRATRSYLFYESSKTFPTIKELEHIPAVNEMTTKFPGSGGIGIAQKIESQTELNQFLQEMKKVDPNISIRPEGKRELYYPIRLRLPQDWRTRNALGFDIASHELMKQAMDQSVINDEMTMTAPLTLYLSIPSEQRPGFAAVLPIFNVPARKVEDRSRSNWGFIFVAIQTREFFERILGAPDFKNEKIAFSIFINDRGKESVLYKRFDSEDPSAVVRVHDNIGTYTRGWSIQARPLPHLFGIVFSNLHNIFGLVILALIILVGWSLHVSGAQMRLEETNRLQLVDSERRVKEFSRTLLKLNLSIRNVLSEISLDRILPAVSVNLREGLQADLVALYLKSPEMSDDPSQTNFVFRYSIGATSKFDLKPHIRMEQIKPFSNLRDVVYSKRSGEASRCANIFVNSGKFESFILLPFIDQSESVVGFALLLSDKEFLDDEFIDSYLSGLVKPIGVALRNSYLYSRAQQAADSKTAFLANMSHEIRTPLGAIVGFSDLLCRDKVQPEYRKEIQHNIQRNIGQLTRIIDDILDFSKIELSQPALSYKVIDLDLLISEVRSVTEMQADDKDVEVDFTVSRSIPKQIEGDDIRLKQVLLNLIGNAIKFTDVGSVNVHVEYENEGAKLRFRVSDTGCGISEDARVRLFQPFSQGDNTNTRRYGGTGLGLVLSQKLAKAMGGDVKLIYTEPGKGSIFEFVVPARSPDPVHWVSNLPTEKVEQPIEDVNALSGYSILLVEDSIDNQEIFTMFLESAGARVDVAKSGDEALIKAAEGTFDIILMDIQIPIIDGKQATRILRKRGWKGPIVALTAHALEEERRAVLQAGCDGQITKPVTGLSLVASVKSFVMQFQAQLERG